MQNTSNNTLPFEYGQVNQAYVMPPTTMLQEIRQILKKHKALNRFGLTQMDSTIQLPKDQVMTESCDIPNRQLHSIPTAKGNSVKKTVETQWSLNHSHLLKQCTETCNPGPEGHGGKHVQTTEIQRF